MPDDALCIGDRYQIGSALFEVTQPRVTCYRVGIRMNEPQMPVLLTYSGRPWFYFRVLQEGAVGTRDEIVKVGEAKERMTVAEINALLYSPNHPRDRLEWALRIEALSPGWRWSFEALLQSQTTAAGSGNAGLEPNGVAGTYLREHVRVGDAVRTVGGPLDTAGFMAARGSRSTGFDF